MDLSFTIPSSNNSLSFWFQLAGVGYVWFLADTVLGTAGAF